MPAFSLASSEANRVFLVKNKGAFIHFQHGYIIFRQDIERDVAAFLHA